MMRFHSYHILPILLVIVVVVITFRLFLEIPFQLRNHMKQIDEEARRALDRLHEEIDQLEDSHQSVSQGNYAILFIAVLSKLASFDRRNAIRSTWMSDCERLDVVCKFFTDSINSLSENNRTRIRDEINTNRDIIQMPFKGKYGTICDFNIH